MINFTVLAICDCEAVTIKIENNEYSMTKETFEKKFDTLENILREIADLEEQSDQHVCCIDRYFCCNHCANHWGVDICACGSGKKPEECDEGFDCCGQPYQSME